MGISRVEEVELAPSQVADLSFDWRSGGRLLCGDRDGEGRKSQGYSVHNHSKHISSRNILIVIKYRSYEGVKGESEAVEGHQVP